MQPFSLKNIFILKKIILLTGLLAVLTQLTVLAQSAHTYWIKEAFPDGKGEVVMTLDSSGTGKIWSLTDGKLLQTINKKDPEWAIKLLRYKIQHTDYTQSGYTYDFEDLKAPDSFYYAFKTNGELVTRLRCASGTGSGFARNRASGRIATMNKDDGKTTVFITDISLPNGPGMRGQKRELATIPTDRFYPYFSHKGTWVFSLAGGTIINVATGAVTRLSKDFLGQKGASWTFNAEETTVSLTKDNEKMLVIDAATGKKLSELEVPRNIRQDDYEVYPCSDGKSFVYAAGYVTKSNPLTRAWLVTEGKVTELKD